MFQIFNLTSEKGLIFWNRQLSGILKLAPALILYLNATWRQSGTAKRYKPPVYNLHSARLIIAVWGQQQQRAALRSAEAESIEKSIMELDLPHRWQLLGSHFLGGLRCSFWYQIELRTRTACYLCGEVSFLWRGTAKVAEAQILAYCFTFRVCHL